MGNKQGLADERGNLFYEIVKIIKAKNPKIVLLENVRNFKNHDDRNIFKTVRRILEKECGYSFILMFLTLLTSTSTRQKTCIHACNKKWNK